MERNGDLTIFDIDKTYEIALEMYYARRDHPSLCGVSGNGLDELIDSLLKIVCGVSGAVTGVFLSDDDTTDEDYAKKILKVRKALVLLGVFAMAEIDNLDMISKMAGMEVPKEEVSPKKKNSESISIEA